MDGEVLREAAEHMHQAALKLLALSREQPVITASATPSAATPDAPSVAAAASTTPTTPASSPSAPRIIPVGLVEHRSGCAQTRFTSGGIYKANRGSAETQLRMECLHCGAFAWFDLTPAPAAAPISSTSAKPDSRPSAAPSYAGFATSPSSESTEAVR